MLKLSHASLIAISGIIWFGIGCFLLSLGLKLITTTSIDQYAPLLGKMAPYFGGIESAALFVIIICLAFGYLKGKFALGKAARRGIAHILTFPNPTSLKNIYSAKYYILLSLMVALGMSIKYLGIPNDIRGAIDVIVGSALINGAVIYFRLAYALRKGESIA